VYVLLGRGYKIISKHIAHYCDLLKIKNMLIKKAHPNSVAPNLFHTTDH